MIPEWFLIFTMGFAAGGLAGIIIHLLLEIHKEVRDT